MLSQRLTGRRARRHRNSRRRWLHRTIGNRVTVSGWGFRRAFFGFTACTSIRDQAEAIAKTVMVRDMLVGLSRTGDLDAVAALAGGLPVTVRVARACPGANGKAGANFPGRVLTAV